MQLRPILLCAALFAVAACAGGDTASYPSLAPRPVERARDMLIAQATPTAPQAVSNPDHARRLATLTGQLDAAETAFNAARAAAGAPVQARPGTDAWAAALVTVGRLTAAAAPTSDVVDDIAVLVRDAETPPPSLEAAATRALLARAEAVVTAQQAEIERRLTAR